MLSHTVLMVDAPSALADWLVTVFGMQVSKQACEGAYIELADKAHAPMGILAVTTPSVMAQFTGHQPPVYGGGVLLSWRVASKAAFEACLAMANTHGATVVQPAKVMPWGHTTALLALPRTLLNQELLIELNWPSP